MFTMSTFSSMLVTLLVTLLFAGQTVTAFWRLPCQGRTAVARIDPLAQFGRPSNHAHVIHGGNNFGFSSKHEDIMKSDCTSCAVKEDKSIYWTPGLYFKHDDGEFELVEQTGGMLVYYFLFGENLEPFPPGFQAIAGETNRRTFSLPVPDPPKSEWGPEQMTQSALRQKALGFNCLWYGKKDNEPTLYRHHMPDKKYLDENCPNGLRLELLFPSCWNGEPDSEDHMSHLAYPELGLTGKCPEGYNKRLSTLLFETIWNTNAFKDKKGEFVLSNGDTTGYGYHGDFINGWESDFLQKAIKTCTSTSGNVEDCPLFTLQSREEQNKCKTTVPDAIKNEDGEKKQKGLPGGVVPGATVNPASYSDAGSSGTSDTDEKTPKKKYQAQEGNDQKDEQPSSTTTVPTLSYSSASTSVSNAPPGINVASIESSAAAAGSSSSTTSSSSTSSSTSSTTATITASVPGSEINSPRPSFVSTTYRTEGNRVLQIYVVQETVSVDADGKVISTTTTTTSTGTVPSTTPTTTAEAKVGDQKPDGGSGGYKHKRAHIAKRHEHGHAGHLQGHVRRHHHHHHH